MISPIMNDPIVNDPIENTPLDTDLMNVMLYRRAHRLIFALCLLGMTAAANAAESRLAWNLTVDIRYDDNIGLAPDPRSERDDLSTKVSGSVVWTPVETATDTLLFTATPFYEGVKNLEDLSNYGAAIRAKWSHQFSSAFTAPWIAFEGEFTWAEFEDSEPRDGYEFFGEVAVGKQFNERIGLSVGVRYRNRTSTQDNPEGTFFSPQAPSGNLVSRNAEDVFDLESYGPFIKLDYDPAPRTSLFFEYNYLEGDVAATGLATGFNNPAAFDALRDFAFEEGSRFLSWRIEADQNLFSAGISQALTDKLDAELSATFLDATGEFNNDYENFVVALGGTWSF